MTTSEIVQRANLVPVPRGRIQRIGWYGGYLVVEYPAGKSFPVTQYIYGPNVAEAERDKLLKVPYPDSLLGQLKKKYNWQSHKVRIADALANEVASREEDARIWERYRG